MNACAARIGLRKLDSTVSYLTRISFFALLVSLTLLLAGCAGKTKPQGSGAFLRPPDANQIQAISGGAIYFTGDVQMNSVPWYEGLTLAKAIIQARYTGRSDPFSITLTRNGVAYRVDVRHLLRGEDNLALEPGDRINVRR